MTLAEIQQIFRIVLCARKGRMSKEQLDWLMHDRYRADYFEACV